MSRNYPFPLPEAIQNEVDDVVDRLGLHPGCYLSYPPNSAPQCLNALKVCHSELNIIFDAIEETASQVSQVAGREGDKESSVLHAVITAFETELDRMWQVLQWGYLTWQYDPAIQKAFSGDSPPSALDPETSLEPTAAAN